jgi:glycosyltransferase involved in cell wall biosynthesis
MVAGSGAAIEVLPPMAPRGFSAIQGREATRASLGVPAEAVVVGTVGKLDRRRGQDVVLHALAAVPGVWGVIVGDGGYRAALERLVSRLGVADRVVFAGFVGDGLAEVLAALDLFVFPATGSDHGHRAIVEAAAYGIPTLAATLSGVDAVVRPGETGELFPPGDAAALAVLVQAWAADAPRRERAGRAARALATGWTAERLVAATAELYRRALERNGTGVRGC